MKKLFIISTVCVATLFTAKAQNARFGFTAGATYANYNFKGGGVSISEKSKIGITAGMMADIPISKSFSFQPAVNFVQKGSKSESAFYDVPVKISKTVNSIEVPLNFLYNVHGKTGGNFFIGAGPSIAFAISGKDKMYDGTNST